jgi:hypothetical protein
MLQIHAEMYADLNVKQLLKLSAVKENWKQPYDFCKIIHYQVKINSAVLEYSKAGGLGEVNRFSTGLQMHA